MPCLVVLLGGLPGELDGALGGLSEKVHGEASSGSLSVSKGAGMGFGHEKPGTAVALLTQLGSEV
jgi:hypothetical protein